MCNGLNWVNCPARRISLFRGLSPRTCGARWRITRRSTAATTPRRPRAPMKGSAGAKAVYLESLQLIERLHRRFLDVVKVELDRVGVEDINNVQAVILYNIADSEITVGELTSRGYYQGSNVTYNLKKLVENGFLEQVRSPYDRRSVRVHLTEKGLDLFRRIDDLYQYQVTELTRGGLDAANLAELKRALLALERFWSDQVRFPSR